MARPRRGIPKDKAESVLDWIAEGKTLRSWCRKKGNPWYPTVYDWEKKDSEFALRIARAREIGERVIADECLDIADHPKRGRVITEKPDGTKEVRIEDMLGHRKFQVDTRLKLLAKWNPRKYGDQVNLAHSGKVTLEDLVCAAGRIADDPGTE